uniref:Derlin n=1 Tax=Panagrolaimus davidi TaxID=227884 RepID=A0A914QY56_9BILA
MSDFSDWYKSIPEITRYWFTAAAVIPLLGRLGVFSPYSMLLDWTLFWSKFQIWRPITALLYYPVTPQTGFHWLLMLYFLYNYSKNLESGHFEGRPADYLFMLLCNWILCTIIGFGAGIYFLLEPMVLSVLYVWCQFNRDTIVSFWFGTRFKAIYLPWILVAFNMVLRGGGINELIGILVGHCFYFLAFQYPQEHGTTILKTPGFLYNIFPNRVGGVHGFGQVPQNRRPAAAADGNNTTRNWGRGHTLGGN